MLDIKTIHQTNAKTIIKLFFARKFFANNVFTRSIRPIEQTTYTKYNFYVSVTFSNDRWEQSYKALRMT